ncbi:MAG: tetratricopeptide repeat protein [Ignavibacteriaceae bacterium]|nr:tetratricopeptide repeat protein [Ignavibacteriaceae bacterium]
MSLLGISVFLTLTLNSAVYSESISSNLTSVDSMEVVTKYSLFSEYYKNKDFNSALPYGWEVIQLNPEKFSKWVYGKMEDALWQMHDSADTAPEVKKAIEDTILSFYDIAIKYNSVEKAYYQARKAFVAETWLELPFEEVTAMYEKAIEYDPNISTYYYNHLGQLYKSKAEEDLEYKTKALDLFTYLNDREPDNQIWSDELESLVDNIDELVELTKKAWLNNKDDAARAWKFASLAMKAGRYSEAVEALEFLTQKSPESLNYWSQLATAYQKTDDLTKAEATFKKLIELEPNEQDNYLNLGIVYKDKGQLSAARTQYQKAASLKNGWGLPIYYEGLLYEQAARNCGSFNFEDKLVYQLAVDTYRKAANTDPSLTQARDRVSALSSSVPTKEDYFFRKYKSGTSIPISGNCYGWIGRSISVP